MCLFSALIYRVENRRTFSFQRKVWFLVIQITVEASIIIEDDLIVCYLYRKKISIKCNFTEDICFCFFAEECGCAVFLISETETETT